MIPATSHNRVSLRNINNWNYEKEWNTQSQSVPDSDLTEESAQNTRVFFTCLKPISRDWAENQLEKVSNPFQQYNHNSG